MPDEENSTPNRRATRGEGHPLREPLRKVVHAIQDGSIDRFELGLLGIATCIGLPHSLCLSVIESFIENAMGWRKGLHR
jgi:hypothetical protein